MTPEEVKGMKAVMKSLQLAHKHIKARVGRRNLGLSTLDFAMGAIKTLLVENGVELDDRKNLKL